MLFCLPTMELGVDNASLNVVNLRNVPPTPANYAQGSGRAGRSGQPALVHMFCSSWHSHDQYFFRRSERVVSGQVAPPQVDLANEDPVRAHIHAICLVETGVSLGSALTDVLDVDVEDPSLELKPSVRTEIENAHARDRARGWTRADQHRGVRTGGRDRARRRRRACASTASADGRTGRGSIDLVQPQQPVGGVGSILLGPGGARGGLRRPGQVVVRRVSRVARPGSSAARSATGRTRSNRPRRAPR